MDHELETEPVVKISIPISEACMLCIGGSIENPVVRKYIRNQIVNEIGFDTYIEIQDNINAQLLNKKPAVSTPPLEEQNVVDFNSKPKRGRKS